MMARAAEGYRPEDDERDCLTSDADAFVRMARQLRRHACIQVLARDFGGNMPDGLRHDAQIYAATLQQAEHNATVARGKTKALLKYRPVTEEQAGEMMTMGANKPEQVVRAAQITANHLRAINGGYLDS